MLTKRGLAPIGVHDIADAGRLPRRKPPRSQYKPKTVKLVLRHPDRSRSVAFFRPRPLAQGAFGRDRCRLHAADADPGRRDPARLARHISYNGKDRKALAWGAYILKRKKKGERKVEMENEWCLQMRN